MTNPLYFCYDFQSFAGAEADIDTYAAPTAIFVTGRSNRHHPAFARARAKGAEVFAYLNVFERPDGSEGAGPLDTAFYAGFNGSVPGVPLWTPVRADWPGSKLTDMRAGSAWTEYCVEYIVQMMRDDTVDGVFLDGIGSRLWSSRVQWDTWPVAEQQAWTTGNVDFVRRLHAQRMLINPNFKIVANNIFHLSPEGERYVDGMTIEWPKGVSAFHRAYVGRTFANVGHRRVFVIARNDTDAALWADVPGVTHVSSVFTDGDPATRDENYKAPTPPITTIKPIDLRGPELALYVAWLKSQGGNTAEIARLQSLVIVANQRREAAEAELAAAQAELSAAVATLGDAQAAVVALTYRVDAANARLTNIRAEAELPA
jgi:hypothetical protein